MSGKREKPQISDARVIIQEVLEADEKYRRELGAFGPDDMRTKIRSHMLDHSMNTLRWWFNTRFPR